MSLFSDAANHGGSLYSPVYRDPGKRSQHFLRYTYGEKDDGIILNE